jgi:hypothetical protein
MNSNAASAGTATVGMLLVELKFKAAGLPADTDGTLPATKLVVLDKLHTQVDWRVNMQSERAEGHSLGAMYAAAAGFELTSATAVEQVQQTVVRVLIDRVEESALTITTHKFCHGAIDRKEADKRLIAHGVVGCYLYRARDTAGNSFAFSMLGADSQCIHSKLDIDASGVSFDGKLEASLAGADVETIMNYPLTTRAKMGLICGSGLVDKTPAWRTGRRTSMQQVEYVALVGWCGDVLTSVVFVSVLFIAAREDGGGSTQFTFLYFTCDSSPCDCMVC